MKRSILFLHGLCGLGGGERYLINLINNLPEEYQIHLVIQEQECTFAKKIQRQVVYHNHSFARTFGPFPSISLSLYLKLKNIIETYNIEFIHTGDHYLLHIGALAAKKSGIKLIFTAHGAWDTHFFINRAILKVADPITLVSTPVHYTRLSPLVSRLFYQPFFTERQEKRKKGNFGNPVRIGIVGRFSPVKNHKLAFEVLDMLKNVGVQLHIFGDKVHQLKEESDAYRSAILAKAASRDDIVSCGFVDDLSAIYDNIDILLITSLNESFGFTAIEAQSFGVPVVTTPTEGSSVTVCDGYSGFIAESPQRLAAAIREIILDYEMFSMNAIENSRKFQPYRYIRLFNEVLNG